VKHQADNQVHNEQTNETNLFCIDRYEAHVCCTRNVKHVLPRSMNGTKALGLLSTLVDFYLRDNLKAIIYWKGVNTRDELWRAFEPTVTST